jgi:hypothetical protein
MLPKVLNQLISSYQENGIYISKNEKIYWFNGKRLEYWCIEVCQDIFTYKNKLYIYSNRYGFQYYKNTFFHPIGFTFPKNHPIDLWFCNLKTFFYNQKRYEKSNYWDFGNDVTISFSYGKSSSYLHQCDCECLLFNGLIYLFDANKNEYYDIKNNKWYNFKNYVNLTIKDFKVYLFKKLFYIFTQKSILVYNPQTNKWSFLKLKLIMNKWN